MILMCALNIYKSWVNNAPHPKPDRPPPYHVAASLSNTSKGEGVTQSKESEVHRIHMLPLLSRLSSVLVICQRKEILKAISILTGLVLPRATLQTSACALLYFKKNPPFDNISLSSNIEHLFVTQAAQAWLITALLTSITWDFYKLIRSIRTKHFFTGVGLIAPPGNYTSDSVCFVFFPSLSLLPFLFNVTISRLRSCAVQVKDCALVIAHTKERPDNKPVNGELQLKEPQWPCMLGIGLDDIKEWNLHWGRGGQAFRKEVLFALYQSAVSHEKKQFKLTLKREYYLTYPLSM